MIPDGSYDIGDELTLRVAEGRIVAWSCAYACDTARMRSEAQRAADLARLRAERLAELAEMAQKTEDRP